MKKSFLPVLAATAALIAASCQQEAEVETASISGEAEFTAATASQATKTTLDGYVVKWNAGDEISINGVTYTGVPDKFNPTWATFSKKNKADASPRSPFKAYYPASLYQAATPAAGAMTILPEEQKYGDFSINPMYAESKNHMLVFNNICAVLAVKLTSEDIAQIKSIRVSDKSYGMCGEFAVESTETGFKAVLTDKQALTPVVLSCGEAVELSEDTTVFHIAIPEQEYDSLKIEISADGSRYRKWMTAKKKADIKANHIYPIDFKANNFYPGTELAGIEIGDVTWAPVNCGYDATDYPYGKLYQWGRIYGQGYDSSDADYPGKSGGIQSLEDISRSGALKSHPDGDNYNGKFYKGLKNWYGGTDKDELWGETKTNYDPCPDGWRVPTKDEFEALKSNKEWGNNTVGTVPQTGYWFNGSSAASEGTGVFLPAAGSRDYSNGDARKRGSSGNYWSSSVNGDSVRNLYFNSSTAYINSSSRASGFSVRCVQE